MRLSLLFISLWVAGATLMFGQTPGRVPPQLQEIDAFVTRTAAAYGARSGGPIVNSKSVGTLTYFNVAGRQQSFSVTVVRKGNSQVQRVIQQSRVQVRQGTDGIISWSKVRGFTSPAQGATHLFIESQTTRSTESLFIYRTSGLALHDAGVTGGVRVIESQDRQGKRTRYFIDTATSLVNRLELVRGEEKDMFGRIKPVVDAYVFSDYRRVDGVLTPFKIERFASAIKIEEMQFSSVVYNTAMSDADFRP